MIKDGKEERICLLDGEKRSVNAKARGDSRGMEQSGGSQHPVEHTMEGKEKIPGGWNCQREANNTQHDHGPVKGTIKDIEIIPGG